MIPQHHNKYQFSITLLEDTHIGTGVGNALIDSFNTCDDNGYPIIWRQHLKGVLREAASDWARFSGIESHSEMVKKLFGEERENLSQGVLIVYSAEMSQQDKEAKSPDDHFIYLSSTALGKKIAGAGAEQSLHNCAAQDGSLRTKQYMRAGTRFECRYQFFGVAQSELEQYQEAMRAILQRMYALGSQKHRATGAITISEPVPVPTQQSTFTPLTFPEGDNQAANVGATINLTFKALEPLRLPATNKPGDLVTTDTFIDANKVLGALANWCKKHDKQQLFQHLLNGEIGVGYAWPAAHENTEISFALPQHFGVEKTSADPQNGDLPWWYSHAAPLPELNINVVENGATTQSGNDARPKLKKVLPGHYISLDGNQPQRWLLHKQKTAVHLRNGLTNRESKSHDSMLFTEEVLPKGSLFTCQIHLPNQALFNIFNRDFLAHAVHSTGEGSQPVLMGRGNAPVALLNAKLAVPPAMPEINEATESVTLVTTSPLLVYNSQLQPHTRLSFAMLAQALNDELSESLSGFIEQHNHLFYQRSSTCTISGFNPASGLPKRSEQAIAPGSVLHLNWKELRLKLDKTQQNEITTLLQQLCEQTATGQKQAQGLGRFYLYASSPENSPELVWASANQQEIHTSAYSATEQVYQQADALWKNVSRDCVKHISKQQWQQLGQRLRRLEYEKSAQIGSEKSIKDIFDALLTRHVHDNSWSKADKLFGAWWNAIVSMDEESQIQFSLYLFDEIWLHRKKIDSAENSSNKEEA